MAQSTMPHPGQEKHLCFKVEKGEMKSGMADYIKLVKDTRYILDYRLENTGKTKLLGSQGLGIVAQDLLWKQENKTDAGAIVSGRLLTVTRTCWLQKRNAFRSFWRKRSRPIVKEILRRCCCRHSPKQGQTAELSLSTVANLSALLSTPWGPHYRIASATAQALPLS